MKKIFIESKMRFSVLGAVLSVMSICIAQEAYGYAPGVTRAAAGAVNIYRDDYGAPHIYAEREEDGFWGVGYVTAEDHLEGVLLLYVALSGDLAKTFGPGSVSQKLSIPSSGLPKDDAVASDLAVRQMRYLEDARMNFPYLPGQVQKNMIAYIDGFRQYIVDHPTRAPAWATDWALDWINELDPAMPLAAASMLNMLGHYETCASAILAELGQNTQPAGGGGAVDGSNVWALPASRMKENAAVFSSDSHGAIDWAYGTFFSATRINAGALNAWFLDIPGMAGGLKAHTQHFAWGWAEGPRRPADCIVTEMTHHGGQTYLYDSKIKNVVSQPYAIEVKGAAPISGVLEYTLHNDMLSPIVYRIGHKAFSVSSTYMHRAGFEHVIYRRMALAETHAQMQAALAAREIYPANLIYAGADGGIHYIRPGRLPIRPAGHDGLEPVNGNASAGAWLGVHPLEDLVRISNPSQQYLVNNNVSPDMMFNEGVLNAEDYPEYFSFESGVTRARQLRAIELFDGGEELGFHDAMAALRDVYVADTTAWAQVFAAFSGAYAGEIEAEDADFEIFIAALAAFDGHFTATSEGALYHALFRIKLRKDAPETWRAIEGAVADGHALNQVQSHQAFSSALAAWKDMRAVYGEGARRFGDVFRVGRGGESAPSHGFALPPVNAIYNGAPEGGRIIGHWTSAYRLGDDGRYWAAVGTRHPFLVQFTNPIRSYSLAVFGASDDSASQHYSDQSQLVATGLRSNLFNPEELAPAVKSSKTYETGQQ